MDYYHISAQELGKGAKLPILKLGDSGEVFYEMAAEMCAAIRANNAAGKPTVFICPVGPVGQYPIFVRLVNREQLSLRNCWFINMDEYLTDDGQWIAEENPLSFRGFMAREVYGKIAPELLMPEEQRVFPDPNDLGRIPALIEELGGVDIAFGGIGITGHLAFNEPQPELTAEQFAQLPTRVLDIHPETRATNCVGDLGGALEDMPRKCVTIGMKEILGARKLRLGVFRDWHRAVCRRAAYGEVTAAFPPPWPRTTPTPCSTSTPTPPRRPIEEAAMDNSFYLKNGSVLWNGAFTPLDMAVEDGRITALSRGDHNDKGLPEVDAAGLRVLPGFLDIHTHGAAGVDVNAADAEGLRTIGRFFASQGVTGWLCSVLTDTPEQTLWCMEQARQVIEGGPCGGAALLGVHLEGPCLSSEYKGAMPEHLLMHTADAELFAKYQKASGGHVRYTTLAPEIPGVPGLIPRLNAMGIVCAMGHSGAGYDQCAACVDAGVRSVTHLGNAMRLFHQHDPAIFGVALERDVYVEAICDGRHLHPGTVRLYLKAKGYDRVVAVTDSIMAAGLPDGSYKLGVNDVIVENGDAKLPNGVRAGSTLTMAQALRNLMAFTGEGAETVSRLMTANPARLMGWAGKGELDVGKDADLVLLDGDYQVARTVVGGRTVYTR